LGFLSAKCGSGLCPGFGRRATGSSRAGAGTAVVGYNQARISAWTGKKHFKVQVFSTSLCELQVSGRTHRRSRVTGPLCLASEDLSPIV
jgi:hypothetical protein